MLEVLSTMVFCDGFCDPDGDGAAFSGGSSNYPDHDHTSLFSGLTTIMASNMRNHLGPYQEPALHFEKPITSASNSYGCLDRKVADRLYAVCSELVVLAFGLLFFLARRPIISHRLHGHRL